VTIDSCLRHHYPLRLETVLAGGSCHFDAPVRTFGVRPALDLGVALAFVVGALQKENDLLAYVFRPTWLTVFVESAGNEFLKRLRDGITYLGAIGDAVEASERPRLVVVVAPPDGGLMGAADPAARIGASSKARFATHAAEIGNAFAGGSGLSPAAVNVAINFSPVVGAGATAMKTGRTRIVILLDIILKVVEVKARLVLLIETEVDIVVWVAFEQRGTNLLDSAREVDKVTARVRLNLPFERNLNEPLRQANIGGLGNRLRSDSSGAQDAGQLDEVGKVSGKHVGRFETWLIEFECLVEREECRTMQMKCELVVRCRQDVGLSSCFITTHPCGRRPSSTGERDYRNRFRAP